MDFPLWLATCYRFSFHIAYRVKRIRMFKSLKCLGKYWIPDIKASLYCTVNANIISLRALLTTFHCPGQLSRNATKAKQVKLRLSAVAVKLQDGGLCTFEGKKEFAAAEWWNEKRVTERTPPHLWNTLEVASRFGLDTFACQRNRLSFFFFYFIDVTGDKQQQDEFQSVLKHPKRPDPTGMLQTL